MKRQAKNLKILFVLEDNVYGSTTLLEHSVSIDSTDGYNTFANSVTRSMMSIGDACSKIINLHPAHIMLMFTEKTAALEARAEEALKYKEGGDVWAVNNRANALASENECLKNQVKGLIEQLSDNISRGK